MLREQANLLELTHDAIFVRDMDDTISYWNRGAEELYGWQRGEAIGRHADELLKTQFPAARDSIRKTFLEQRPLGRGADPHREGWIPRGGRQPMGPAA